MNVLDPKGIKLSEVDIKYPKTFQTLGYDVSLDYDEMSKPKILSTFELCVNSILTLLFMKPGQYPSIPTLGIDINKYLFEYSDDPNIIGKIKNDLNDQCNRIQLTGLTFECSFDTTEDGDKALVIMITGNEKLTYGSKSNSVIIGITYDKLNRLYMRKSYV